MTDKAIVHEALMKANLAWQLADEINWYELIFSHNFAKAFWGEGLITRWWIYLTDDIANKPLTNLFNKAEFIKLYDKEKYEKCRHIFIPLFGKEMESLNAVFPENPQMKFLKCFKKKYRHLISYESLGDWKEHLKQMVLEKDPIKYLEKFLII